MLLIHVIQFNYYHAVKPAESEMFTYNQRSKKVLNENIQPRHDGDNIQALPATQLVKFEEGMQSKISNDACIHTKETSFVDPVRNDRLVLISFWE